MEKTTRDFLISQYAQLSNPKEETAIKFSYTYNEVKVKVYFDAYDIDNLQLQMVLSYEQDELYTLLNADAKGSQYIDDLGSLSNRILHEKHLARFYEFLDRHILNDEFEVINYKEDNELKRAKERAKKRKGKKKLSFIAGLRRVKMSERMYRELRNTTSICSETLQRIQNSGMTIVRTDDSERRKKISFLLDKIDAELKKG